MMRRIRNISSKKWEKEGVDRFAEQLVYCGYKRCFLNKLKRETFFKRNYGKKKFSQSVVKVRKGNLIEKEGNEIRKEKWYGLTYGGIKTERIQGLLAKRGIKTFFGKGIKIGKYAKAKKVQNEGSLFKKELSKKEKGVIYQIDCRDCVKKYIGETGRKLEVRMKEHGRAIKKMDMNNAIAKHCWEKDHLMDVEKVKIIKKEGNLMKRRFLESWSIKNERKEVVNLSGGWEVNQNWLGKIRRKVYDKCKKEMGLNEKQGAPSRDC